MATSEEVVATVSESEEPAGGQPAALNVDPKEKECLVRAMYFESNRSSEEGLLGVGTVVMNRLASPDYPDTICDVVGQPRQFAEGVLTKPMSSMLLPQIEAVADNVLAGKRHADVGSAMHFHTEGFSYTNMHYVAVAGGNAFYEKRSRTAHKEDPFLLLETVPLPRSRPIDSRLPAMETNRQNNALTNHIPDTFPVVGMQRQSEDHP